MNIIARFTTGKRLNLIQRFGYEMRVNVAGLRHNQSLYWHSSPWKHPTNRSPRQYFKKYINNTAFKTSHQTKGTKSCKKRLFDQCCENESANRKKADNTDYGQNCEEPEDPEILKFECLQTIKKLQVRAMYNFLFY